MCMLFAESSHTAGHLVRFDLLDERFNGCNQSNIFEFEESL